MLLTSLISMSTPAVVLALVLLNERRLEKAEVRAAIEEVTK